MSDRLDQLQVALADHYHIERELGAGGMATVYLAEDRKHHRKVALKVLRPELSASLGSDRFVREITIAAALSHPHILPLYDSGESGGFLYYVMPFVEGQSLRQKLVREGEQPVADAIRILRDMADAMAYAHQHGVVHRDIKPENVMLSGRHALVTDFGVAKAVSEATGRQTLTTPGVALGTPTYMAPEQAMADPHVDHRADIYAWGVVAYELLAGRPPFDRATPQAMLAAHLTEAVEPVTKYRGSISPGLATLVMRALEKRPADRWQHADELITQLETLLTPSGGMTPASPRRSRAVIGAGVLAVALAALAAWWFTRDRLRLDPGLVVVAPFENRSGKSANDAMGADLADRLTDLIARTGVTQAVPAVTVRDVLRDNPTRTTGIPALLSRRTSAGLVVVGSIHARGDSLEYGAEIVRQPAGKPIGQVEPVVAGGNSAQASEALAERLATLLAANKDWGDDVKWGRDFSLPGDLAAYQAFVEGATASAHREFDKAVVRFDATLARAPGWPLAAIGRADADFNRGAAEAGDSALARLLREPRLLPGDRARASFAQAYWSGQWDRGYANAVELYQLAPKSFANYACWASLHTARHEEAAGYARHLKDTSFWSAATRRGPNFPIGLRVCLGKALHALGKHREELDNALALRRDYPESPFYYLSAEIEARAGLHQPAEVERLLSEVEGLESSGRGVNLSRAVPAGDELQAHGDTAAALRAFDRAVTWDRQRLERGDSTLVRVNGLMDALMSARRWNEFRSFLPLYASLAQTTGDSHFTLWNLAMLEAGTGNRPAALDAIRRFERMQGPVSRPPYLTQPVFSAMVYAALGDTAQTLVKLREAYALGDAYLRRQWLWHRGLPRYITEHPTFKQLVGAPR